MKFMLTMNVFAKMDIIRSMTFAYNALLLTNILLVQNHVYLFVAHFNNIHLMRADVFVNKAL